MTFIFRIFSLFGGYLLEETFLAKSTHTLDYFFCCARAIQKLSTLPSNVSVLQYKCFNKLL